MSKLSSRNILLITFICLMGCNTFDQNSRKVLSKPTLKQEINKICGISNGISILADKYKRIAKERGYNCKKNTTEKNKKIASKNSETDNISQMIQKLNNAGIFSDY